MSERDALVRAVLAAPEDDAPRLVFADWCDENGDSERGEFIRLQIATLRSSAKPSRREYRLFNDNWTRWVPQSISSRRAGGDIERTGRTAIVLPGLTDSAFPTFTFQRGFIYSAVGPYHRLIGQQACDVWDTHPVTIALVTGLNPLDLEPPAEMAGFVREVEQRNDVHYASHRAGVLGSAVVLWHRWRLGL
jgi:uncharacterized protein (TIGR02996 family)